MRRVLAQFPEVARTSLYAACAACDAAAVEAWLARDPQQATAPFPGAEGWRPIECVAGSPLSVIDAEHAAASVAIAERLLALGADANTFTAPGPGEMGEKLPVLYRASTLGNAGLVKLLLEHGAEPNDGESVYHAAEHDHREVLELLFAHGADLSGEHPHWTNTVLYFLAGYRELNHRTTVATSGMRWLLEHGADPNVPSYRSREVPLHRIAEFGRGAEVAEMLLAHGADPARPRADGRTPYELAMRAGNRAVADVLRARGAAVDPLRPVDALLSACAVGDVAEARRIRDAHPGLIEALPPEEQDALVHAAAGGRAGAVRALLALGFDPAREGEWAGTALHQAAWRGHVEAVRALLEAGAPVDVRDRQYGSSPIAWASHGSVNCREADDDYLAVVDLLLDAGSAREPSFNRWGEAPEALASDAVAEHLRARGFAPPE